jgi:serine protease inhibitor
MTMKTTTLLGFLFLMITACNKGDVKPATGKELVLTAAEQQKANADNAFTIKLFKTTLSDNPNDKNLFLSPLSVSMAIGMTSNGSNGQTLTAIRQTMNFDGFTEDQVNSYYHKLITELPGLDPKATLKIANSIWYTDGFTPMPAFLQTNSSNYNAQVQGVDFKSAATKDLINKWVTDQTNGKITKIIDQIPDNVVMYLINAIYFKSTWKNRFDIAKTQKADFHTASGSTIQTYFMNSDAHYNVATTNDAIVVELPYGNERYSMVLVSPNGSTTVKDYVAGLDSAKWRSLTANLQEIRSFIALPKFKFSYEIKLKDVLSTLGMANAFADKADFTRITPGGGLRITEVKHKTYVDVDEEGTEAAAVTSVAVGTTAVHDFHYKFDHPFIFAIREMKTGLILFAGVMNDPTLPPL